MSFAFTPGFGGGNKPTIVNPNPSVPLVIFTAFDVQEAEELKRRLQMTVRPAQRQAPAQKPKADGQPAPSQEPGAKSASNKQQRQQEDKPDRPGSPPDLASEPERVLPDLENAWTYEDIFLSMDAVDLSYYSSLQEYDLVRDAAISLRHEKLILFHLDNPREYLKRFATYTWDEEADAAAEEFIQWYVERFRPALERQLDFDMSGPAFGEVEEALEDLTTGELKDAIRNPTFGEAGDTIKRWQKDLTNDENESVIAIDLKTGETLFVRYGDEDSVTVQDKLRKLVEEREIVLLHNHPNNSAASLADLAAGVWLDAEFMFVVNPDGTLHRYALEGDEMVALEPTHNPDYVAPSDPLETLAADVAYWVQSLSEIGNPPEMVMLQEPNDDEITINTDSRLVDEFLLNRGTIGFLDDVANEYGVEDPSFLGAMVATIIYRELRGFGSLEFAGHPSNQHFWDYWKVTGNAIPYFNDDDDPITIPISIPILNIDREIELDGDPSLGIGALNSEAVERILRDAGAKEWDVYVPLLGFDLPTTFADIPFSEGEHKMTMFLGSEFGPTKHLLRVVPPSDEHKGVWRIEFPETYVPGLHGIQSIYEPTVGFLAAEVAIAMQTPEYQNIIGDDKKEMEDRRIAFLIGNHANRSAVPRERLYNPQHFSEETENEIRWARDFMELMDERRTEIQSES